MNPIDKARKLLALAESSNPHEAALAAERAAELMLRHNLTEQTVRGTAPSGYASTIKPTPHMKLGPEDPFIMELLDRHFFVRTFGLGSPAALAGVSIVGTKANVTVAVHVYKVLLRQYRGAFRDHLHKRPGADRHAFYHGAHAALMARLEAQRQAVTQEMALTVVEDAGLTKFVQDKFNVKYERGLIKQVDSAAYSAGHEAGKQMRLDTAVTSDRRDKCKSLPDSPE
jgi:hypothetical protein